MIVCSCAVINDTICKDMLKDMSVNDFCKISGAGYTCGSCIPTLVKIKQGVSYGNNKASSKTNDEIRNSKTKKKAIEDTQTRFAGTTVCTFP